jgi:peptidyl-prolyl cis-trans isomerase D
MLKTMSDSKFFSVFLLGGIVFIITISFIFWGIAPPSNQVAGVLATVEGRRILLDDYYKKYDAEYRRLREVYKSDEELEKLNLKESVLANLIDRAVLLAAAEDAGIGVTEDEVRDMIVSQPYFQSNGVFDPVLYERTLNRNRMTVQSFEEEVRDDLIVTKMSRLIGETAELTPDELKILDSIQEGKARLIETFLATKRNQAVKVYIEGLKKKMDIVINDDLIL